MDIQLYAKMLVPEHVRRNQQRRCKKRLWYPNRDCLQILEPGRKFAKEPTSKEEPVHATDAKVLKRSYISGDKESLREDDAASGTYNNDSTGDSQGSNIQHIRKVPPEKRMRTLDDATGSVHTLSKFPSNEHKPYPSYRCNECKKRGIRKESRLYCNDCPNKPAFCRNCFNSKHM